MTAPHEPPIFTVYVLHFARPLQKWKMQHYTGVTRDLARRLNEHRAGLSAGSIVARQAKIEGVPFTVAFIIHPGTQKIEYALKRRQVSQLCPMCGHDPSATFRRMGLEGLVTFWPMVPIPARFAQSAG